MTQFTSATLNDDGSISANDTQNHEWKFHFAGERPTLEQVFPEEGIEPEGDPPAPVEQTEPVEDGNEQAVP